MSSVAVLYVIRRDELEAAVRDRTSPDDGRPLHRRLRDNAVRLIDPDEFLWSGYVMLDLLNFLDARGVRSWTPMGTATTTCAKR
jgi:hypothetical protein